MCDMFVSVSLSYDYKDKPCHHKLKQNKHLYRVWWWWDFS